MTYQDWEQQVPEPIRLDPLWKVEAYRLGLFLGDLSWLDARKLAETSYARGAADQLLRAAGNISSNVAEGYSRSTSAQRCLFYGYALGSAREARDWYYKCRRGLGTRVATHRIELVSSVVRLLLAMIRNEGRANRRIEPRSEA